MSTARLVQEPELLQIYLPRRRLQSNVARLIPDVIAQTIQPNRCDAPQGRQVGLAQPCAVHQALRHLSLHWPASTLRCSAAGWQLCGLSRSAGRSVRRRSVLGALQKAYELRSFLPMTHSTIGHLRTNKLRCSSTSDEIDRGCCRAPFHWRCIVRDTPACLRCNTVSIEATSEIASDTESDELIENQEIG